MVIRIGKGKALAEKANSAEAVQKLFLFHMEFAVRHLCVPGRVECWSIIIDCTGADKLPMWKSKDLCQVLGSVLGKVYSGRMIWLKIFNFPAGFAYRALRMAVEGVVSALGKTDKVSFVTDSDFKTWFAGKVHPGQLEKRYGGTAPDLPDKEVFPYRMFATPEGYGAPVDPET